MAERIYAIWEYYDGIRTGIASFEGAPHYFEQEWSEGTQDYLPTFELKRIDQSTLTLVLEQWRIFREWETAHHRGEVSAETHPGLPGQHSRYGELEGILKRATEDSNVIPVRARGKFDVLPGQEALPRGVMRDVSVEWQREA